MAENHQGNPVVVALIVALLVVLVAGMSVVAWIRREPRSRERAASPDEFDAALDEFEAATAQACALAAPPAVRLDIADSHVDFLFAVLVEGFDTKEKSQ